MQKLAKWGYDSAAFLARFNPAIQSYCARNPERCFTGDAPTLREASGLYGREIAESWLDIQLSDLARFTGAKGKDAFEAVIDDVIQVFVDHFGHLKVSELALFFQWCKAGRYGHFYGSIDAMVLTEALQTFCAQRAERLARIERRRRSLLEARRRQEMERLEAAGLLMTYAEWKEVTWLYNMGYERKESGGGNSENASAPDCGGAAEAVCDADRNIEKRNTPKP